MTNRPAHSRAVCFWHHDARAVAGLDEAIARANAALRAGTDMAFVEAAQSMEELALIPQRVEGPAFFPHVHASEAEGPATPRWAEVTLTLHDGRRLQQRVQTLHGSTQQPLTPAELASKLDDCLRRAAGRARGNDLLDACLQLSALPARDLVARLQHLTQPET